jgi:hypothetical protein
MRKTILGGLLLGGFVVAQAQCKTVSALTDNFDTWKDINKCWTAQQGKAMLYASEKRIIFYSMNSPGESMFLVTPKIKAGSYTLTLDSSDNGGKTMLELFSIGNTSDTKSYTSITKPSEITGDQKVMTVTLKKDAYLGLKVLLNGIHQAVYLDNFSLKPKK